MKLTKPDRRKPAGANAVVKLSNGRGPPRAAHLLENAGSDVVHTLMIDSEGFEIVARRDRDIDKPPSLPDLNVYTWSRIISILHKLLKFNA